MLEREQPVLKGIVSSHLWPVMDVPQDGFVTAANTSVLGFNQG